MATRSFWLFLATMFVCGSGDYLATSHFINFATDYGVSAMTAGKMMGWYGLLSFAGILVAGPAADRIGSKIPIVLTFLLAFFSTYSSSTTKTYRPSILSPFSSALLTSSPLPSRPYLSESFTVSDRSASSRAW